MQSKPYRLSLKATARKEALALPLKVSGRIERALQRLLDTYRAGQRLQDMRKLQGIADTHRLDSGEYRILFTVDEQAAIITVHRIRHRRDVYRNL
jgi:mRNA interferase RelE/StbE